MGYALDQKSVAEEKQSHRTSRLVPQRSITMQDSFVATEKGKEKKQIVSVEFHWLHFPFSQSFKRTSGSPHISMVTIWYLSIYG